MNRSSLRRNCIPGPLPSPLPPPQPRDEDLAKSQPRCVCFLGTASFPEGHKGTAGTQHPQPRELAALHQLLLDADDNDEQSSDSKPAHGHQLRPLPWRQQRCSPQPCAWFSELWWTPRAVSPPHQLPDLLPPPATPGTGHGACRRPRKTSPFSKSNEMNLLKSVGPRAGTPQLSLLHYTRH